MALDEERISAVVKAAVEDQLRQEAGYENPTVSVDGRGRVEVRLPEKVESGTVVTVRDAMGEKLLQGTGDGDFWVHKGCEATLFGQGYFALAGPRVVSFVYENGQTLTVRPDGGLEMKQGSFDGRGLRHTPGGDALVSQSGRQVLLSVDGRLLTIGPGATGKADDPVLIQETDGAVVQMTRADLAAIEVSGRPCTVRLGVGATPLGEGELVEALLRKDGLDSTCVVQVGAKQYNGPTAKYARWSAREMTVEATDPRVRRLGQDSVTTSVEVTGSEPVMEPGDSELGALEDLMDILDYDETMEGLLLEEQAEQD